MVSLGGDLMHPVLFRKRIRGKHKLFAYSNNPGWEKHYEKIFVRNDYIRDKFLKAGASDKKLKVTGDLVYSSLKFFGTRREIRGRLGLSDDEVMLMFLPGSREFEVKYMLPVFLKVIDDITKIMGSVKPFLLKSPYISYDTIKKALLYGGRIKEVESIPGELHQSDENREAFIRYSGGKEVPILEGGLDYWGRGMDFVVTLPGTNTIQLAYRKIPSLVVAALNKPEVIPIEGILGLFKWVPVIGKAVIRKAFLHYVKKFRYASLPNIYTNSEVIPELFGIIQTSDITERVEIILKNNEHFEIKERLAQFSLKNNPVERIVREVWGS
jgi:lipid-A-disaccharide synthase